MKGPTAAQTKKLPPGLVAYMKKHGQPGIAATKELDAIVKNQQTTINELNTKISNHEDENISLKEENTLIKSKLNEILTEMGKETI